MKLHSLLAIGLLSVLCVVSPVRSAVTYNLASDFSDLSNPNGVWSFLQLNVTMTHYPQPGGPPNLYLATTNGFWGFGSDYTTAPFLFRTTGNGSVTGEWNDGDFLAGDVVAHTSNGALPLQIRWTAPGTGNITYSGSIWYAHSPVTRAADFAISLDGVGLESGSVSPGQNRTNSVALTNGTSSMNVTTGDILELTLTRNSLQSLGSMAGVAWSVEFTPIPEPSTVSLFAGLGWILAARRRRR